MDFVTTATLRPEIFHRTFESFKTNLFGSYDGHRLIVNMDRIGETGSEHEMKKCFSSFFGTDYVLNITETPNFMRAIMWVWKQATSKYVFQLEDDWLMLRPMDLQRMIDIMDQNRYLAVLRLPRWASEQKRSKQWNRWFVWNGDFYECPSCMRHRVGYSGNPSLIRREFMEGIVNNIWKPTGGPEQQLNNTNNPYITNYLRMWTYGVYQEPESLPAVVDIGREWRTKMNLKKNSGTRFYRWIR